MITFLWKDSHSGTGDCPALYQTDDGYIVVGKTLTDTELAEVRAVGGANNSGIAPDEIAVKLPANVLDRLRGN